MEYLKYGNYNDIDNTIGVLVDKHCKQHRMV